LRHHARRLLASLTLAVLALSLVAPALAGGRAAPRDCPLAPAGGGPAFVAGMDGGSCEHTDVGPCLTALGCVAAAPAIRPAATSFVASAGMIVLGTPPAPHPGDLYRTGPPTPPPNSV
jgi:hypothetical protein